MTKPLNFSGAKDIFEAIEVRRLDTLSNDPHEYERDNILMEYADRCAHVREIGVQTGITCAMFLTQPNVKKVSGIDIKLSVYEKNFEPHMKVYSEEHGKELHFEELDSHSIESVVECDMLHIDSLHKSRHLQKELELHANSVKKYIAFHDVNQNNRGLYKTVLSWMSENKNWQIAIDYDEGTCGCLIIERI